MLVDASTMATLKPVACRTPLHQFSRAVRRKSAQDKYKYDRREKGEILLLRSP
jgi:hypothetical protein